MNTNHLTTLRWNDLVNPDLIGRDILVEYASPANGPVMDIFQRRVNIVGTAYIGNDRVLLVYNPIQDDVFIIMREGQGYLWDAYLEV